MIFSNKNAYYINKILTVIFFVIICFIAVYSFIFVYCCPVKVFNQR